jgi:hypothetical protein
MVMVHCGFSHALHPLVQSMHPFVQSMAAAARGAVAETANINMEKIIFFTFSIAATL